MVKIYNHFLPFMYLCDVINVKLLFIYVKIVKDIKRS
jgi:hypothetical protein